MAKRIKTGVQPDLDTGTGQAESRGATAVTGVLALLTTLCAVLALTGYLLIRGLDDRRERLSLAAVAEQAQGRQLVRTAAAAVQGEEVAWVGLRSEYDRLPQRLAALAEGAPAALAAPVAAAQAAGTAYVEAVNRLLAAQADLQALRDALAATAVQLAKLEAAMADAAILIVADGVPAEQALEVGRLLARIETMKASFASRPAGGSATLGEVAAGTAALEAFGTRLNDLIAQAGTRPDSAAAPLLAQTALRLGALRTEANALPPLVPRVLAAHASLASMRLAADRFAAALGDLAVAACWGPRAVRIGPLSLAAWAIPLFGGLALASLLLIAVRAVRAARRREAVACDESERNLLASARALRGLQRLESAARDQGEGAEPPIAGLSDAPGDPATAAARQAATLTAESTGAELPAAADTSAPAGTGGATAGRVAVAARRLERLGETAQALGEHVALINECADQTSLLALNAAVQATLAGAAGHGFAVVGDDLQCVAERVQQAARQLQGLVRSIESDTHAAARALPGHPAC